MENITCERQDAVAVLTLNRPDKGNALLLELKEELVAALREIKRDKSVRAVVITGEGKLFSAGGDISTMGRQSCVEGRDRMRLYCDWLGELVNLELPVVAAVNGSASGAGLSLALACDFIVAAESAKLICSFSNLSLVPDMACLYFLPRRIGQAKAKRMAFDAKPLLAPEALAIGLVDEIYPAAQVLDESLRLARELAARPTYALGMIKKLVNRSFEMDFAAYMELEAAYQAVAFQTDDHAGAVEAFREKRPPAYKGQ